MRLGRSVMGPTLDRIYQLSGVIALTPSTSYDILHTSFGSDWRGAFLIHSRHAGAEFEGTWSKLRITRRLSLSGGPLPSCIGGPASPPEAMLQVGIPGATYRQMPPNKMERISLFVDRDLVDSFFGASVSDALIARVARGLHGNRIIEQLMAVLLTDISSSHPTSPIVGETIVNAILHELKNRHPAMGTEKGARLSTLECKQIRDYVTEDLRRTIHLDDLAALLGINVRRLCRAFRNTVGMSPHQYIMSVRVEHARDLLRQSRLDVEEIAELSGFADRTHMNKCFRKIVGQTPSEARRTARSVSLL